MVTELGSLRSGCSQVLSDMKKYVYTYNYIHICMYIDDIFFGGLFIVIVIEGD